MITAHLMGGLGNQMFQLAACYGHANKMETTWAVPSFQESRYFNGVFATTTTKLPRYHEPDFSYIPIEGNDIELFGYFQSDKYWKHCEKEILQMFQPKQELEQILIDEYSDLILKDDTCAIHVRRGDYVQLKDYHYNLEPEWYVQAKEVMGNKYFVCFSDDIEWCTQNIEADRYLTTGKAIYDLFLMSYMKNFIIANSSFSWWASFLSQEKGKKVIAPKNWFGEKKRHLITSDLYREEMIVI